MTTVPLLGEHPLWFHGGCGVERQGKEREESEKAQGNRRREEVMTWKSRGVSVPRGVI